MTSRYPIFGWKIDADSMAKSARAATVGTSRSGWAQQTGGRGGLTLSTVDPDRRDPQGVGGHDIVIQAFGDVEQVRLFDLRAEPAASRSCGRDGL